MENKFNCPIYKKCGGCQLDVSYPQQLSYKQNRVTDILGSFCHVEPIIGMNYPYHYRCKVQSAFGFSRGRAISGIWQSSSGRIAQTDSCMLENKKADEIIVTIRKLLKCFKLTVYDENTGRGFLRFVLVRCGHKTGQYLVALGTGTPVFPSKTNFVKALVEQHPEITTIVQSVSTDRLNLVLGKTEKVLYGNGTIEDVLCSRKFLISAKSFFQVNPSQTETLYKTAVKMANLTGKETVIDAYCGVGTIGIIASKNAKNVISIEQNTEAVKNALQNVKLNGIKNVRVYSGDAGDFMCDMSENDKRADVVFMDPPRAGCSREFLIAVAALAPKKAVYISCNPETQARDIKMLLKYGYEVKKIQPVDMFPHTRHIETVVLLERKER